MTANAFSAGFQRSWPEPCLQQRAIDGEMIRRDAPAQFRLAHHRARKSPATSAPRRRDVAGNVDALKAGGALHIKKPLEQQAVGQPFERRPPEWTEYIDIRVVAFRNDSGGTLD